VLQKHSAGRRRARTNFVPITRHFGAVDDDSYSYINLGEQTGGFVPVDSIGGDIGLKTKRDFGGKNLLLTLRNEGGAGPLVTRHFVLALVIDETA
jgi:hypothetical protein